MSNINAVIFDLDGTLIDSAPDLHAAMNAALADLGRAELDLARVVSFIGNGVEVLVTRALEATGGQGPDVQARALEVFLRAYEANPTRLTRFYPGVEDCLETLRAQGVTLGLCTNKPQAPADRICAAMGLTPCFAAIHGARDDVPKKPDPAPLLNCMADIGTDPQHCLYVGDSAVDHKTAEHAGLRFALFTGGYLNSPLIGPEPVLRFDAWTADWPDTIAALR